MATTEAPTAPRFQTRDPDEFVHALSPYAPETTADYYRGRGFSAEFQATRLGRLGLFRVKIGHARVRRGANPYVAVSVPLDNPIEFAEPAPPRRFGVREAHLLRPETRLDLRTDAPAGMIVATFPEDWFASKALSVLDRIPAGGSRFSLETPEGGAFSRYARFVWGEVAQGWRLLESPIATREIEDAFLTLLLLAADQSDTPPREREQHVQRAEEYMRGHLRQAVTIDDITRASGVSGRTLLRAFRRYRGTTTVGFLRLLRLEAAHRDLRAMDATEATVTRIATRYAFYELGRFASYYRSAYGELPSKTLAR